MALIKMKFLRSEDGAITVDWVVLTAAAVGLAGAAMVNLYGSTGDVGDHVGTYLTNYEVTD
jgi:hypothetical protein